MSFLEPTPQLPTPDGTVEEIWADNLRPGTNVPDGTKRMIAKQVSHGRWSARIDLEKKQAVTMAFDGMVYQQASGHLAFENAGEMAAHFHRRNYRPPYRPGTAPQCLADLSKSERDAVCELDLSAQARRKATRLTAPALPTRQ